MSKRETQTKINTVAVVKNSADVAISVVKSKISKAIPDIKTGGGKGAGATGGSGGRNK